MSETLNLNNFAKSGLNSDLAPWELAGDFLTNINNIRISNNKLTSFGGYHNWAQIPLNFKPGYIMKAGSISSPYWVLAGDNKVYSYNGSVFDYLSSQAYGVVDPSTWTGCMVSDIAVITNKEVFPEYWTLRNDTPFVSLPWDSERTWQDVNQQCGIIRSHKQFLFALDSVSEGVALESSVRWSSPADVNSVPESWDELDTTNVAGIVPLGGFGGRIIDGQSLRDAFVVYRENSIHVFDFVGGQFVWQVRELTSDAGLISPECVVEVKGKHYFMGVGDIFINDGNTVSSLLHNRLKKKFNGTISAENYKNSYIIKNSSRNEIWFCVPDSDNEYPNIAFIYNWIDDSWSIRDIPIGCQGAYGSRTEPPLTWGSVPSKWSEVETSWGSTQISAIEETLAILSPPTEDNGYIYILDSSIEGSDVVFNSVIERTGFALAGVGVVTTIQTLYPRIKGDGNIYIELGSQEFAGAPISWKERVLFNPKTDRKVSLRTTGELHCFKIYTENQNSYWEFSGMDIEYVKAGQR